MSFYNSGITRPNRFNRKKDVEYHTEWAKYALGTLFNVNYKSYINKCLINWSFYKGGDGQWIFEEDTEGFFLDESGDIRNRIKWTKNLIKPMVQQFIGNAIRLSYDARAECISPFVINKREDELKKLKGFNKIAETYPFFKDIIKDRVPIGDTELETEEIFENSFVDDYDETINNLLEYISKDINIDELKVQMARNLALSGICIYHGQESGDIYTGEAVNPLYYGWDMSAQKPDLSDREFEFEWGHQDVPSLVERYPNLSTDQIQALETYCQNELSGIHRVINGIYTPTQGKVPVYNVVWKDSEKYDYGWVMDEFGYPMFVRVNDSSTNKYTDKDLIPPVTEKHKKEMGDKKKISVYDEVLRYCILVLSEEVSFKGGDIVLEWGVLPYQEKTNGDPSKVKFPRKVYTWGYDRGEVLTPLDDAIDPQRFLNRAMSVVEAHLSNMRGSGTAISKDAVDDNEAETLRNINASKPIFVDTARTGSIQNSIGQYGTNIGSDTYNMFQVIREIQTGMQDVTGVNEAMTGTQGGQDALVGVIEAQIQRGSLVQEPFYWALTSTLTQAYDHMGTVGKQIYYDNPYRLAMMVGDDGVKNIVITEDHKMQDYRTFINRAETREQGIQAGNQLLFTLLNAQLIDDIKFSNLFGRANSTQIARALREHAREKSQAKNMQDKLNAQRANDQAVQQEDIATQMANATMNASNMQQVNGQLEHERELEKIDRKEQAKVNAAPVGK